MTATAVPSSDFAVELPAADLAALRKKWSDWRHAVESIAEQRQGRLSIDPAAFRALQQDVLKICQTHAAAATGEQSQFFLRLADHVRPWVSPESLAQADRDILFHLVLDCMQAEKALGGRERFFEVRRWMLAVGVIAALGGLGAWAAWRSHWQGVGFIHQAEKWCDTWILGTVRTMNTPYLYLTGVAAVLIMIYIVISSVRR